MSGRASSSRGQQQLARGRGGREARALQGWLMEPTASRRSLLSTSPPGGSAESDSTNSPRSGNNTRGKIRRTGVSFTGGAAPSRGEVGKGKGRAGRRCSGGTTGGRSSPKGSSDDDERDADDGGNHRRKDREDDDHSDVDGDDVRDADDEPGYDEQEESPSSRRFGGGEEEETERDPSPDAKSSADDMEDDDDDDDNDNDDDDDDDDEDDNNVDDDDIEDDIGEDDHDDEEEVERDQKQDQKQEETPEGDKKFPADEDLLEEKGRGEGDRRNEQQQKQQVDIEEAVDGGDDDQAEDDNNDDGADGDDGDDDNMDDVDDGHEEEAGTEIGSGDVEEEEEEDRGQGMERSEEQTKERKEEHDGEQNENERDTEEHGGAELDQKILQEIIQKMKKGRRGQNLYKGLGRGWRKYCTAAKKAVRASRATQPRSPRGRSAGDKRKHPRNADGGVSAAAAAGPAGPASGDEVGGSRKSPRQSPRHEEVRPAVRTTRVARASTMESRLCRHIKRRRDEDDGDADPAPTAATPASADMEEGAGDTGKGKSADEDRSDAGEIRVDGAKEGGLPGSSRRRLSVSKRDRVVAYRPRRVSNPRAASPDPTPGGLKGAQSPPLASSLSTSRRVSGGAEAGRAARGHSGKATAAATNGSPHVRQQQGDSHATGVGTRNALEPGVVSPRGAGVSEGPRIDAKERSRGIPVAGAGAAGVAADTAVAADAARSPVANAVGVREEGVLRPSIVLAKNPNREGHLWPARLCDRDEVQESYAHSDLDAQAQEHRALVVFLCEGGHHYFAWIPAADISSMPAGDDGLGEEGRTWSVDFTAGVMWARRLSVVQAIEEKKAIAAGGGIGSNSRNSSSTKSMSLEQRGETNLNQTHRQDPHSGIAAASSRLSKPRSSSSSPSPPPPSASARGSSRDGSRTTKGGARKAKGGGTPKIKIKVKSGVGASKRGNKLSKKSSPPASPASSTQAVWKPGGRASARLGASNKIHLLNARAHSFFTDELECPWRCKGCKQFTRSCDCSKGLDEYVRKQGDRAIHRFERFVCGNNACIYCKPPGLPLIMAEWAASSSKHRFKLKDGHAPPPPPPQETRLKKSSTTPRWEREAIAEGRVSARAKPVSEAEATPVNDEGLRIYVGGEGASEYSPRRLGANERCNKCTGCLLPNCGKCWACGHRIEFGGTGHRNQPCVDRWCRAKAAQREADKTDRAHKGSVSGGTSSGGTKRPRQSSPEGYEAEDAVGFSTSGGVSSNGNAKLDTNTSPNENNSSSKKFRRARRPVGSGIGARGPHGGVIGTGTAAKRPPILSREGDAGLSFVFAGENDASESPANREAMHVAAEVAGIVVAIPPSPVVGNAIGITANNGSNNSNSGGRRLSSVSRHSKLKDLLRKGYRCLALLEELGPKLLLNAAAGVLEAGEMRVGRSDGEGKEGKDGLIWGADRQLAMDEATSRRLETFDPFHEVPEIEMSTSIKRTADHDAARFPSSQLVTTDEEPGLHQHTKAAAATAATSGITPGRPNVAAGDARDTSGSQSPLGVAPAVFEESAGVLPSRDTGVPAVMGATLGKETVAAAATAAAAAAAMTSAGRRAAAGDDRNGSLTARSDDDDGGHRYVARAVGTSKVGMEVDDVNASGAASAGDDAETEAPAMSRASSRASVDGRATGSPTACAGGRILGDDSFGNGAVPVNEGEEDDGDDVKPVSRFLGVRKQDDKWVAHIRRPHSGGDTKLGVFDDEVDAAKQYDKYAKMWLETPDVNFPRGTTNSRLRGGIGAGSLQPKQSHYHLNGSPTSHSSASPSSSPRRHVLAAAAAAAAAAVTGIPASTPKIPSVGDNGNKISPVRSRINNGVDGVPAVEEEAGVTSAVKRDGDVHVRSCVDDAPPTVVSESCEACSGDGLSPVDTRTCAACLTKRATVSEPALEGSTSGKAMVERSEDKSDAMDVDSSGDEPSADLPATTSSKTPSNTGDGDEVPSGIEVEPPLVNESCKDDNVEEGSQEDASEIRSRELDGLLLLRYLWGEENSAGDESNDVHGGDGGPLEDNGKDRESDRGLAGKGEADEGARGEVDEIANGSLVCQEQNGVANDPCPKRSSSLSPSPPSSSLPLPSPPPEPPSPPSPSTASHGGDNTNNGEAAVIIKSIVKTQRSSLSMAFLVPPAVSRNLRRGYLAQSLARILGTAGLIQTARRTGVTEGRDKRFDSNDNSSAKSGVGDSMSGVTEQGSTGNSVGVSDGMDRALSGREGDSGVWAVGQEQAAAAVEALDALDRGVEELLEEDERSLRRYTRVLERNACRPEMERLQHLQNEEAKAIAKLARSRAEEEEQKGDLAQLEAIATRAFSTKSAQALQSALETEREAAAAKKEKVQTARDSLDTIEKERETLKRRVSEKEREAVASAHQTEFIEKQALLLSDVRLEWAALRCALRRRIGAARTLLLTDSTCRLHAVPTDRLEQPRRMDEAWRALLLLEKVYPNETLLKRFVDPAWIEMVTPETILMLAHSRAYVDQLRTRVDEAGSSVECLTAIDASDDEMAAGMGEGTGAGGAEAGGFGGGGANVARDKAERAMAVWGRDTVGNKRSWEAAMTAAGAVLEAVDRVLHGEAHNAFCAVRPPGHHAGVELHCMGAVSNGFCILNNVALAALYAHHYGNVARIAVVDFDVHHGNGTQDVLCRTEHPGFLYASIHAFNRGGEDGSQARIFPGTGAHGEAHGNVVNIPLADQVHPAAFHAATGEIVAALDRFKPNLILLSAGFDAHQADPSQLGTLRARDFEVFTRKMVTAAERLCGGRLVSVLEGGYALDCQSTVRRPGQPRPPSPVVGVFGRAGRKARGAAVETLADCVQAHCKGLVDGLIGGVDDDQ